MTPRERAEALEEEAEETDDPDTWLVVSDAWLEVGNTARAWFALLQNRRPYETGGLITRAHADHIQRHLEKPIGGIPVTNNERGALELFRFMAHQPERVFAYHSQNTDRLSQIAGAIIGDDIGTFMGDHLGTIVHRGRITRPFGGDARIQYVHVRGINGYLYRGTCALDNGEYCKLRRAEPWLR